MIENIIAIIFGFVAGCIIGVALKKLRSKKTVINQVTTKDNTTMIGIIHSHDNCD